MASRSKPEGTSAAELSQELLAQEGYYYELYSRQFEEESATLVFAGREEGEK